MADHLVIDRCICKRRSFAELLVMAQDWDHDVDCVMLVSGAGLQCGRCRPWLAQAIRGQSPAIVVDLGEVADADVLAIHFST
ncbi:hypothetical protein [Chitinivorax sp. B]|uniref:hypothetical protein n=1 Tax=Chitinivorax sp. B TaxID=2502235 RepID=UPI0010F475F9|nr:hypothetical protein [Chitinivorax sp. B]